jgi:hypothetical protein
VNCQLRDTRDQPTIGVILTALEQIRSTMGSSGAFLTIRDSRGLHWLASAGHVPALGSSLQIDSEFTRECLDTGRVVLCEDSHDDPRIRPGAARLLRLRSAIAVPINFRGHLIGIIELFSSLPSTFNGAHVATLREAAELLAPVLASLRASRSIAANLATARSQISSISSAPRSAEAMDPVFQPQTPSPFRGTPLAPVMQSRSTRATAPLVAFCLSFFPLTASRAVLLGTATAFVVALIFLFTRPAPITTQAVANREMPVAVSEPPRQTVLNSTALQPTAPPATHPQIVPNAKSLTFAAVLSNARSRPDQESSAVNPGASALNSSSLPQSQHASPTLAAESASTIHDISRDAIPSPSAMNSTSALSLPSPLRLAAEIPVESSETLNSTPVERALPGSSSGAPALLKSTRNSRSDFVLDRTVKGSIWHSKKRAIDRHRYRHH